MKTPEEKIEQLIFELDTYVMNFKNHPPKYPDEYKLFEAGLSAILQKTSEQLRLIHTELSIEPRYPKTGLKYKVVEIENNES